MWVAFFAGGKLKKVAVTGGAVVTLAAAALPRGGDWGDNNTIVFLPAAGGGAGLFRVNAAGGPTERALPADPQASQRWPQVLPGGKAVLYTRNSPADGQRVIVHRLSDGQTKILQADAAYGRYVASGHLIYLRSATLFAAPFDLDTLEITGAPVPIIEGVTNLGQGNGAQFAVSASGTLLYLPGASQETSAAPIVWVDGSGNAKPLRETASDWANPTFSPDGRKLAMDVLESGNLDIAVYDLDRDTLNRLTTDVSPDTTPAWTPDGKRLTYRSLRLAPTFPFNIFSQPADGARIAERLTESRDPQNLGSWHPNGRLLAFEQDPAQGDSVIMILPFEGSGPADLRTAKPNVFPTAPGNAQSPAFSPDGRFLAYTSYASGRAEIRVRPFPGPGGEWAVSNGGNSATWSRARQELFYNTLGPDNRIMVVPYKIEGECLCGGKAARLVTNPLPDPARSRLGTASRWQPRCDGIGARDESDRQAEHGGIRLQLSRRSAPSRTSVETLIRSKATVSNTCLTAGVTIASERHEQDATGRAPTSRRYLA